VSRRLRACGAALAAAVLAGCAGGVTDRLVLTDFAFEPAQVRVPADGSHVLEVVNDAALFHDMTVDLPEGSAPVHLGLFGGASGPYALPELPPGTYPLYCSVEGHREAGMEGSFTVLP
jgi:plastocyanin